MTTGDDAAVLRALLSRDVVPVESPPNFVTNDDGGFARKSTRSVFTRRNVNALSFRVIEASIGMKT
jgi:hypothetical protein